MFLVLVLHVGGVFVHDRFDELVLEPGLGILLDSRGVTWSSFAPFGDGQGRGHLLKDIAHAILEEVTPANSDTNNAKTEAPTYTNKETSPDFPKDHRTHPNANRHRSLKVDRRRNFTIATIATWNVRGLQEITKCKQITKCIEDNDIDILALQETKVPHDSMEMKTFNCPPENLY